MLNKVSQGSYSTFHILPIFARLSQTGHILRSWKAADLRLWQQTSRTVAQYFYEWVHYLLKSRSCSKTKALPRVTIEPRHMQTSKKNLNPSLTNIRLTSYILEIKVLLDCSWTELWWRDSKSKWIFSTTNLGRYPLDLCHYWDCCLSFCIGIIMCMEVFTLDAH